MKLWTAFISAFLVMLYVNSAEARVDVNCERGDCLTYGWNAHDPDNYIWSEAQCLGRSCEWDGWEEYINGRFSTRVECFRGGCFEEGYEVFNNLGRSEGYVECLSGARSYSDCLRYGWVVYPARGPAYKVVCRERNCRRNGWVVRMPHGYQEVRCKPGGCFEAGWVLYP